MTTSPPDSERLPARVYELLKRHWGYDELRPLQPEAIRAVMERQDSLVVLPTGGGKSLCYQLPALCMDGMAVIVSPLLALIQDQVDGLRANGITAASINSSMTPEQKREVQAEIRAGALKLLYVAPEALVKSGQPNEALIALLREARISFVAIDEAHCISQWGHEYRPAYRSLGLLRQIFPDVALHGFTATATEVVRADIAGNLGLRECRTLVGDFNRPNLTYRTAPRKETLSQVREVLDRHAGEAGIIYCIRKVDVDSLAATLKRQGYRALPYHADLSHEERRNNQRAFINEEVDIIVATVAFGMGIDRSNVRFVLHAGMPKAIENYQQEAGRAGRDGLPAECVLIYSSADAATWRRIQGSPADAYGRAALDRINEMYAFCQAHTCRHRFLTRYFGQHDPESACQACDVCLGEKESLPQSGEVARQILAGVQATGNRYGGQYVAQVLKGSNTEKVRGNGGDRLPEYGSLRQYDVKDLSDWLEQLVGQEALERGEYGVLRLTDAGRRYLDGEGSLLLTQPREQAPAKRGTATTGGSDDALFQALRAMRLELARERGLPPYIIFHDAALQELARLKPTTLDALSGIKGVGQAKVTNFGERVLAVIREACATLGFPLDIPEPAGAATTAVAAEPPRAEATPSAAEPAASMPVALPTVPASAPKEGVSGRKGASTRTTLDYHRQGLSPQQIAQERGLAVSTIRSHLAELVEAGEVPLDVLVSREIQESVREALSRMGSGDSAGLMALVPASVDYADVLAVLGDLKRSETVLPLHDPDMAGRLQWLAGARRQPSLDELPSILQELAAPDPWVRAMAALTLGRFEHESAWQAISGALGDPEPQVCMVALRGIRSGDARLRDQVTGMAQRGGLPPAVAQFAETAGRRIAKYLEQPPATP